MWDDLDCASSDYAVKLVDRLLLVASDRQASDLHLESTATGHLVRLRIDGRLVNLGSVAKGKQTSIANRIKSLAGLLTYRHDIPQEGRILFGASQREARVSTFPTLHGERIVLRLVAAQTRDWHLHDLGLSDTQLDRHQLALQMSSGVIVISGAVGTGKTTTAYAALRWLAEQGRCVVTLEDPIESELPEIAQSQVDPHAGFDWTTGLKSLLRQDAEVVFIGEIRDALTAQTVFRASLTGQLVLTTMHARSPQEALERLLDMEVPSQHILSSLVMLSTQQLVPIACPCTSGCDKCHYTGSTGRHLQVDFLPELTGDLARGILSRNSGGTGRASTQPVHGPKP